MRRPHPAHRPAQRPAHRPRPILTLLALGALCTAPLTAGCGGGEEDGIIGSVDGPALAARSVAVDLGELWEGETRRHSFVLESVGTEPFVIVERSNSCGCSEIEWFEEDAQGARTPYTTGEPLEPGHRLVVDVVFDSTGRPGAFDDALRLYSPHPEAPRVPLGIRAFIRPLLDVTSVEGGLDGVAGALAEAGQRQAGNALAQSGRFVDLGVVQLGSASGATATLTSNAGPLALTVGDEGRPPAFEAELVPLEPDDQGRAEGFELRVTLAGDAPAGPQLGTLTLVSDQLGGDDRPLVSRVHVQAVVRGLVESVGGRAAFGALDAGMGATVNVPVLATDPELELPTDPKLELEAFLDAPQGDEDVSDWFRASWEAEGGQGRLDLELLPLPEGRFGTFQGVVRIPLGLEAQPRLEVPFVGTATGLAGPAARFIGPQLPPPGAGAAEDEG